MFSLVKSICLLTVFEWQRRDVSPLALALRSDDPRRDVWDSIRVWRIICRRAGGADRGSFIITQIRGQFAEQPIELLHCERMSVWEFNANDKQIRAPFRRWQRLGQCVSGSCRCTSLSSEALDATGSMRADSNRPTHLFWVTHQVSTLTEAFNLSHKKS